MKYEYLCGYESDFFTMPENIIAVVQLDHCVQGLTEFSQITECGKPVIAMRRIIAEPKRWTAEDQRAGRLPEVGSVFTHRNETLTCLFIDADGEIWAHDINNRIVTPSLRNCYPLETPEEKAARLRDEWVEKAVGATPVYEIASHGYSTQLRIDISSIYDAMISGDLPVPVKGE